MGKANSHPLVSPFTRRRSNLLLNRRVQIRQPIHIYRKSSLQTAPPSDSSPPPPGQTRSTHLISPPSPIRIIPFRVLHLINWERPVQLVYVVLLPPCFRVGELFVRSWDVEFARAEESSSTIPSAVQNTGLLRYTRGKRDSQQSSLRMRRLLPTLSTRCIQAPFNDLLAEFVKRFLLRFVQRVDVSRERAEFGEGGGADVVAGVLTGCALSSSEFSIHQEGMGVKGRRGRERVCR